MGSPLAHTLQGLAHMRSSSEQPYLRRDYTSFSEMPAGELTPREMEVLELIACGRPNKQAASELSISIKTVEKHRQKLMSKLDIHNTAGLTHYAIYVGLVPCNPQLAVA